MALPSIQTGPFCAVTYSYSPKKGKHATCLTQFGAQKMMTVSVPTTCFKILFCCSSLIDQNLIILASCYQNKQICQFIKNVCLLNETTSNINMTGQRSEKNGRKTPMFLAVDLDHWTPETPKRTVLVPSATHE